MSTQQIKAYAVHQSDKAKFASFSHNRICYPISNPFSLIGNLRTFRKRMNDLEFSLFSAYSFVCLYFSL